MSAITYLIATASPIIMYRVVTALNVITGADCHAMDIRGKCPFDYVADHEEWIGSGHFPDDIRALLKGLFSVGTVEPHLSRPHLSNCSDYPNSTLMRFMTF